MDKRLEKLADKTWEQMIKHLQTHAADEAYTELVIGLQKARDLDSH